jgi:hypothetical protein
VILQITQGHATHRFERGKTVAVPIAEIVGYEGGLREMLDEWATGHLEQLDRNLKFRQLVFDANGQNREGRDITLGELIATHL